MHAAIEKLGLDLNKDKTGCLNGVGLVSYTLIESSAFIVILLYASFGSIGSEPTESHVTSFFILSWF